MLCILLFEINTNIFAKIESVSLGNALVLGIISNKRIKQHEHNTLDHIISIAAISVPLLC